MKKFRRIFAVALCIMFLCGILPSNQTGWLKLPDFSLTANAATSGTTGDCTWTLDGTVLTISGNGKMKNYSSIDGDRLPWGKDITKVIIDNGVTSIGNSAFSSCESLTSIEIPDSVTSIGYDAFSYCSRLTSITIPDSITFIGYEAFYNCVGLTTVYITDLAAWCNIDFDQEYIEGNGVPTNPLYYAKNLYLNGMLVTDLIIPEGTKEIKKYTFSYFSGFTSITIPDSVISIGGYAFYNCDRITSVTIGNGVTSISDRAFTNCTGLMSIFIPDSVTFIGSSAFSNCAELTSITIPNSVASVGNYAFNGCDRLEMVYYRGSLADRIEMYIGSGNDAIFGKFIYESCIGSETHTYDNSCDATCNVCSDQREINHTYDNNCDAYCNICNTKRSVPPHSYTKSVVNSKYLKTAATCTKAAVYYKSCSCGAKGTATFTSGNAKGHKYTKITTKAATTSSNGHILTECSVCGVDKSKTTIYAAKTIKLSATSYTYNGKVKKPTVSVKDSKGKTISSSHYTVKYASGRKNIGKYKVTVTFKGNYSGTKTLYFTINPKIKISATKYTYNGKAKKPTVKVTNSSGKKIATKYYSVSYSSGRKKVGKYTVTIKFKNGHSGTYKETFTIVPKGTSVSKLTAAKKSLKVSIKKQSTQTTGYEIQYSTSKKFTSSTTKTKTIKSYKTTSSTIKSLKAKKTYYVRVRTYKTVSGKKYYSGWSTVKSKKTK